MPRVGLCQILDMCVAAVNRTANADTTRGSGMHFVTKARRRIGPRDGNRPLALQGPDERPRLVSHAHWSCKGDEETMSRAGARQAYLTTKYLVR